VAALQSQTGQGATGVASGVCPYTWTRDLSSGSTGGDVMKLQQFLNADPDTRVAASGAGSVGAETEYYGPATAAAVSKFQVKYRSEILSPANLVNPTGYFGPSSRVKANGLCVAAPVVDDSSDDMMDDEDDMMDDEDDDVSLGGEASLDTFEIDDPSDDTVQEGSEDVEIGTFTVEFKDGDAEISRIDIALQGGDDETDPWDTFESVSLWVDGDKIAEEDADSRGDYLDDDDGSLRFSGLDLIAMEEEEVEIVVAASLQSGMDDSSDGEDWMLYALTMRYFDADGVASTDGGTGDLDDEISGPTSDFTIEEAGADDELIAKTSSNDPDAATLQVEDDSKSDWYTVFVFDLDTDDSTNDITINEIKVNASTTLAAYSTLVDDAELVIDGVTIDSVTVTNGTSLAIPAVLTFDVDGDVTIEAGDRVEAELMLRFKSLSNEGATVKGSISSLTTSIVDAEGADDLGNGQLSGSATGETHTLRTAGADVSPVSTDADVTVNDSALNDYATFEIEFEVTAFEQDVYIAIDTATSVQYALENSAGVDYTVPAASSTAVLTSTADEGGADDAFYEVTEGSTETFTLTVTYTPVVANRSVRLAIDSITFDPTGTYATGNDQVQVTEPASDYRTSVVTIVN
ncbi:hypothetical protein KC906_03680, partial [Candidatus Kaiserbacteria bacterium]|nr:hypothetical protein [Candidatus Kaiserbacteria bacterium]